MCVTYDTIPAEQFRLVFDSLEPTFEYKPRIWPGYDAPILRREDNDLTPHRAVFGMIPFFANVRKVPYSTVNARSEQITRKPTFRGSWRRLQVCVIPAARFYEPNYESGKSVWWAIERVDAQPFGIAGLWDTWKSPEGTHVLSFTMLTVNADGHPLMSRFHKPGDEKRSIVVLDKAAWEAWLTVQSEDEARTLLNTPPVDEFTAAPAP